MVPHGVSKSQRVREFVLQQAVVRASKVEQLEGRVAVVPGAQTLSHLHKALVEHRPVRVWHGRHDETHRVDPKLHLLGRDHRVPEMCLSILIMLDV